MQKHVHSGFEPVKVPDLNYKYIVLSQKMRSDRLIIYVYIYPKVEIAHCTSCEQTLHEITAKPVYSGSLAREEHAQARRDVVCLEIEQLTRGN